MRKTALVSAVALALGCSAAQAGDIVTINPDAGGGDAPIQVGALGWQNGNAISVNANGLPVALNDLIQTFAHASLANFTDVNGNVVNVNPAYEWTYVLAFQEIVSLASGTPPNANANFQVTAGGTNFFEIWFDPTKDADNLTGKGFNDGQLILSGTILPFDGANGSSSFNATGYTGQPLDTFIANNYPSITSVSGTGSTTLLVDVGFYDTNFFSGIADIISVDFDAFQNTPYSQQNPSSCFWNGAAYINGAGPITGGTAAQTAAQCAASSVGGINGVTGPNFMFETRSSSAFTTEALVPEPGTLAMLGIGLAGLGFARRRKG